MRLKFELKLTKQSLAETLAALRELRAAVLALSIRNSLSKHPSQGTGDLKNYP
jgi:hypothetical protein